MLGFLVNKLTTTVIATELKDSTLVIIAQRVSSVMNADKIMVLDKGRIIGLDKHENLLESCDIYREIYDTQMEGGAVIE